MLKDLTRVGLACVAGLLLVLAYTTWRIWDQGNQDEARPADAIVVLGAAAGPEGDLQRPWHFLYFRPDPQ